jgi:hypothetical protein
VPSSRAAATRTLPARRAQGDAADRDVEEFAAWFIEVNGMLLDARDLPLEIQVEAYLKGIIPYVPDLGRDGTAAIMAAERP